MVMEKVLLVVPMLVLMLCGLVKGQGVYRYYDFTPSQQAMIVNEHNRLRALEPAMDMQELVWDSNLAEMSRYWAGQCTARHTPNYSRRNKYGYDRVGEAIWWSNEQVLRTNLDSIVYSFYSEKPLYDFPTGQCRSGSRAGCGHYTQVVWADTCAVGCAAAYCANIINGGGITTGQIVVCNYGPTGNIRGYDPYTLGSRCANCPNNGACTSSGLCTSQCTSVRSHPFLPSPIPAPAPAPVPAPVPKPVPPQAPRQTDARASVSPKCVDKDRMCPLWAKANDCVGNPWMTDNCSGSCNKEECTRAYPVLAIDDCSDRHDKCAEWATSGECSQNQFFMKWKCPVACKLCRPSAPTHK